MVDVLEMQDFLSAVGSFLAVGSGAQEAFETSYLRWRAKLADPLWVPSGEPARDTGAAEGVAYV